MYELGVLIVAAAGLALLVAIPLSLMVLEAIARAFGEKARPWVYMFYAVVGLGLMGWHHAKKNYWSHVREVCETQIKTLSPLTDVSGVLDEATEVSVRNVLDLLTKRRLQFVETRIDFDDQGRYRLVNARERVSVADGPSLDDRIARFTLAEGGGTNCLTHEHKSVLEDRPFLQPTCLSVSFHRESEASHVLRYEPKDGILEGLLFQQVTVRHAESNRLLASVILARDEFHEPGLRFSEDIDQTRYSFCPHTPHSELLRRIQENERLPDRMIQTSVVSPIPGFEQLRSQDHLYPTVSPALNLELVDVNTSNALRVSHTWSKVMDRANETGWSTDGGGRVKLDQRLYEVIEREPNGAPEYWGKLWTRDGFFVWSSNQGFWRGRVKAPLVAKYNERGNLLWAVKVEMPAAQQECFMEPDVVIEKGARIEVAGSCRGNLHSVETEAGLRYRIGRFSFKAPAATSQ